MPQTPVETGAPASSPNGSQDERAEAWAEWGRSAPPLPRTVGSALDAVIERQPRWLLFVEALALVAAIAALDYLTGTELAFSVFYLVPVIFVTWFISRRVGALTALVSAAVWTTLDSVERVRDVSPIIVTWNGFVRLAFFIIVMQLIYMMKDSRARQADLARTDSLTGIANGRSFSDRARFELASMRRTGHHLTLAYVDLDRFKRVNDTLGHSEGDRLLRRVGQAIQSRVRATDLVARLGGDEFGILLPDTDSATAPTALAAITAAIGDVVEGSWDVGCTVGAVTFEMPPESVDFMVRAADELMYEGKKAGRGRIEHAVWPPRPAPRRDPLECPTC